MKSVYAAATVRPSFLVFSSFSFLPYRFMGFSVRTRFLIPHFILFPLFAFPPSGAVDKIVLPDGMQSVNFEHCRGLTGTTESRMSDGHIYLIRFGGHRRSTSFIPHFILFFRSFPPFLFCLSSLYRIPRRRTCD